MFICTNTLNSDPILFFYGTCHKTQSQTNRHPSIDRHSLHVQPEPYFILNVKEGEKVYEYMTVWFLAFWPDQWIHKEEEEGSIVSDKLKSLHNGESVKTILVILQSSDTDDSEDVIFT